MFGIDGAIGHAYLIPVVKALVVLTLDYNVFIQ